MSGPTWSSAAPELARQLDVWPLDASNAKLLDAVHPLGWSEPEPPESNVEVKHTRNETLSDLDDSNHHNVDSRAFASHICSMISSQLALEQVVSSPPSKAADAEQNHA